MTQPTADVVLAVLHEHVSLDLPQVASRALLPPSEVRVILDGYVASGRVRLEGGPDDRYLLSPASPLADWFAGMCDHAEAEPHECNLLLAAHDVALLIRDSPLANTNPGGQPMADNTLLDLDRLGRMLDLPAPDPRVSQLHMQAVTDLFSRWEGNCEAEFTHCDAATELRNALAAACTCRALPHDRRCPSRSVAPRVRERVMPEPSAEQAHPTPAPPACCNGADDSPCCPTATPEVAPTSGTVGQPMSERAHCAVHDFTACTGTCTHPFYVCSECKERCRVNVAPGWCRDKACQDSGHVNGRVGHIPAAKQGAMRGLTEKASMPDPRDDQTVPNFDHMVPPVADDAEMKAFVAGWFAHARNAERLFVEDAWGAYRLSTPPAEATGDADA